MPRLYVLYTLATLEHVLICVRYLYSIVRTTYVPVAIVCLSSSSLNLRVICGRQWGLRDRKEFTEMMKGMLHCVCRLTKRYLASDQLSQNGTIMRSLLDVLDILPTISAISRAFLTTKPWSDRDGHAIHRGCRKPEAYAAGNYRSSLSSTELPLSLHLQ